MSCDRFETWIALYVEGDLPRRRVRRLEQHLAECGRCRELAATLRGSQAALGELRDEAPEAAVLGRIRARVLDQIAVREQRPGRRFAWAWAYAAAAALIAVIALAGLWPSPHREPQKQQVNVAVAPKPAPPEPSAATPPPAVRARQRKPRPAHVSVRAATPVANKPAPEHAEPLVVKLVTDDPNVVIIWLVDRNGD